MTIVLFHIDITLLKKCDQSNCQLCKISSNEFQTYIYTKYCKKINEEALKYIITDLKEVEKYPTFINVNGTKLLKIININQIEIIDNDIICFTKQYLNDNEIKKYGSIFDIGKNKNYLGEIQLNSHKCDLFINIKLSNDDSYYLLKKITNIKKAHNHK